MIRCLPSAPEYVWVTRIDWMISLTLRLAESSVTAEVSVVSSRCRTSCWVMVEAPRGRPRIASMPAATMPTGSKPALSQKLESSIAVVASTSTGGMSLNSTTLRLNSPNRASSTLCSRSQMTDCSGSSIFSSRFGLGRPWESWVNPATATPAPTTPRTRNAVNRTRPILAAAPMPVRRRGARVFGVEEELIGGSLPFGCGSGHGTTLATIAPSLACIPCPDARRCRFLIEP